MISREGISQHDFDHKLLELVAELSPAGLLCISGVYAVLSEYFNDEIIVALDDGHEEDEEDDDEEDDDDVA